MGKISLICEQCGGNIVLDRSGEMGTCESCFAQFVVKQDQIIQKITKNITKHVYGYQGKDVEELYGTGMRIYAYLEENPGKIKLARRFFTYYLDTAAKLVERYVDFQNTGLRSEEVKDILRKTAEALPVKKLRICLSTSAAVCLIMSRCPEMKPPEGL